MYSSVSRLTITRVWPSRISSGRKPVPVARAWRALHVFRLHAAAFQIFEIALVIAIGDHVLGDTAVSEVPGHRLDLHRMDARPAVD